MNTYDYNISDIVNKYSRHVAMLSYTYTKNIADAEDIAQDVFLQLIKSNKKFENEEHLRAWLFRSFLELEPKYRIPIHLFYYEGYSIKEISAILHEKEATIGTRLDRARKKLKDKLESDYYGS